MGFGKRTSTRNRLYVLALLPILAGLAAVLLIQEIKAAARPRHRLDDVVDGQSVAERRKQQAAAGKAARDAEEARYKQSAKDLDAMKKNTAARTDHDLLDDPV